MKGESSIPSKNFISTWTEILNGYMEVHKFIVDIITIIAVKWLIKSYSVICVENLYAKREYIKHLPFEEKAAA